MRTTPVKSVVESVVRLHSQNPRRTYDENIANTIIEHVNNRVHDALLAWDWVEWNITEERAYRQVWNASRTFKKVSDVDGKPDELFYISTAPAYIGQGYYKVKTDAPGDPPMGTLPTNTTYFAPMENVDPYIAYDQVCRRSIGQILGVYKNDPRWHPSSDGAYKFKPSERGIEVYGAGAPTAFVFFQMPEPVYTMLPHIAGKQYTRGKVVLDPATGECFQALTTTAQSVSTISDWRRVPFLSVWFQFVRWGAYADSLIEMDRGPGEKPFAERNSQWARAEQKATEALVKAMDSFIMQGQTLQYGFRRSAPRTETSQPWSGGTVSTLTDACESDLGWVYPTTAGESMGPIFYYDAVNSLKTTTPTLIATVPTLGLPLGHMAIIRTGQHFTLETGTAPIPTDPGQGNPTDFHATTNNKHWKEVL